MGLQNYDILIQFQRFIFFLNAFHPPDVQRKHCIIPALTHLEHFFDYLNYLPFFWIQLTTCVTLFLMKSQSEKKK